MLLTGLAIFGLSGCNDDDSDAGRLERVTDRLEDVADRLDNDGGRFLLDASTPQDVFLLNSEDSSAGQADADMNAADVALLDGNDMNEGAVELTIQFDSPEDGVTYDPDNIPAMAGLVSGTGISLDFVALSAQLYHSESDSVILPPIVFDRASGRFSADLASLQSGLYGLTVLARAAPDVEVMASIQFSVSCAFNTDFQNPLDPELWRVMGSASLHSDGWLEMTNTQRNTAGGIFLVGQRVNPGNLDLSFSFALGAPGCDVPDTSCPQDRELADGLAVTFWDVEPEGIETFWGGLGGNGANYSPTSLEAAGILLEDAPEGFTIEFDSYPNRCPNNGWTDPIQGPHIEIKRNGEVTHGGPDLCDASYVADLEGVSWLPFPALTDNYWHDVRLRILGSEVVISIDGEEALRTQLPEVRFKGGILAFSGGSGAVGSFQRFDNLTINGLCQ